MWGFRFRGWRGWEGDGGDAGGREYAHMAHDFCPPELRDIKSFIMGSVPKWEGLLTAKSNPAVMEGVCQKRADYGMQVDLTYVMERTHAGRPGVCAV